MVKCEVPIKYTGYRNSQIAYRRGFSDRVAGKPAQRYYKPNTAPSFAYDHGWQDAHTQIQDAQNLTGED